jgi:drug/metabolite transporter (DMT)-like permease
MLVVLARGGFRRSPSRRSWAGVLGPVTLFTYAAPFSFAYLRIGAAVGALVLFGCVQLTMIGWGMMRGERLGPRAAGGIALAAGGLLALTLPGATRPDLLGTLLMVVAGISWGVYSLVGRGSDNPLAANTWSFAWALPLTCVLTLSTLGRAEVSGHGVMLAVISGAVTSGLGYAIWYRALRGLSATQAGVVQLTVPILAGFGAVLFLGEAVTTRMLGSAVAVLGGVALAITAVRR